MRYRLVKTGKTYAEPSAEPNEVCDVGSARYKERRETNKRKCKFSTEKKTCPSPVIWNGTADEYHQLLVLYEAELVAIKARLSGDEYIDWYTKNRITDLEIKVAELKNWLNEAIKSNET